jgi:hypothetical protein
LYPGAGAPGSTTGRGAAIIPIPPVPLFPPRVPAMNRLLAASLFLIPTAVRADDKADFFESKIRPVLVEQCQSCHSAEAEKKNKLKGGLLLDTKEGWAKGGDSGPAIVPGKPKDSLLLKTMHYDGDIQMPPKGKLAANVLKDFEKWIADGATDPRSSGAVEKKGIDLAKGREFWSFQQPKEHAPPKIAKPVAPIRNDIDAFIQAKWQEKGLVPASLADKRTLIRRVTFDLTGLPPTPEAVDAFVKDDSPDAFRKLVDMLLASPQYGERYARMWLDVARYAEDQAHTFAVKPKRNAYRYRDWVIDAFNADMPFDKFALMQIAGDLVPAAEGEDPFTKLGGMGFLGLGAEYYKNTQKEQAIADELDDRVDTLTRGFLGLTVSCARCHDHKFDPIPQQDYYAIAGIFFGSNLTESFLAPPAEVKAYTEAVAKAKAMNDKLKKMENESKKSPKDDKLTEAVKLLQAEIASLTKEMPKPPASVHILSGGGSGMKMYIRGNPYNPGPPVAKGFLQVVASNAPSKEYTRLDLAKAVASKDNPLTARVIVNRIWQAHFGRGLVNTPSNFGQLGDRPTHPELLDSLAARFMANGWSLKWLHREILNTTTYQLSSGTNPQGTANDPANVYLWRAERRRLDVEAWRDSLLSVAGNLDATMGGPTFDLKNSDIRRRTVYAKISRHDLDGLLRLFDFPDANVTADKRTETTVPQQQLFALNSPFMANQAKAFAERIAKGAPTEEGKVEFAYRIAFDRLPSKREKELALAFLKAPAKADEKLTRWQQYAQVLLASNEMMYVD